MQPAAVTVVQPTVVQPVCSPWGRSCIDQQQPVQPVYQAPVYQQQQPPAVVVQPPTPAGPHQGNSSASPARSALLIVCSSGASSSRVLFICGACRVGSPSACPATSGPSTRRSSIADRRRGATACAGRRPAAAACWPLLVQPLKSRGASPRREQQSLRRGAILSPCASEPFGDGYAGHGAFGSLSCSVCSWTVLSVAPPAAAVRAHGRLNNAQAIASHYASTPRLPVPAQSRGRRAPSRGLCEINQCVGCTKSFLKNGRGAGSVELPPTPPRHRAGVGVSRRWRGGRRDDFGVRAGHDFAA